MKAVLVYQGGIANVFRVKCFNMAPFGRDAVRLMQGAFTECQHFARGMGAAGAVVRSAACNQAGDITNAPWTEYIGDEPFADKMSPVYIH